MKWPRYDYGPKHATFLGKLRGICIWRHICYWMARQVILVIPFYHNFPWPNLNISIYAYLWVSSRVIGARKYIRIWPTCWFHKWQSSRIIHGPVLFLQGVAGDEAVHLHSLSSCFICCFFLVSSWQQNEEEWWKREAALPDGKYHPFLSMEFRERKGSNFAAVA